MKTISERLQELFEDEFREQQPLAKYTSARVGGVAQYFVIARTRDELKAAAEIAYEYGIPYFILGGGSNILVADDGVPGLVIQNRCKRFRFRSNGLNVICTVDSGMNLSSLARQCINKGLGGLEWAVSVPGSVGGAVFGNAGAHGSDTKANLVSATVWEPEVGITHLANDEMGFAYRGSTLKTDVVENRARRVVLSADFELMPEQVSVLQARADGFVAHRKETQPAGATMGSMFKNPEHYYAGYLIDTAGLKGTRIGGVHVADKHANFFLNDENATAKDIVQLIDLVYTQVRDDFNVELEPEVELVGDWYFNENYQHNTKQDARQDAGNDSRGKSGDLRDLN